MLLYHICLLSCSSAKLSSHVYRYFVGRKYSLLTCVKYRAKCGILVILWCNLKATPLLQLDYLQDIYRTPSIGSIIYRTKYKFPFPFEGDNSSGFSCLANAWRIQWNCRFNLFRFYFKKSWKDTITFLHDPHLSYPWSYGPNGYSMNYHCALSHILVIKFMVWNMKDQTAKCHYWFVSISCQASVWLEEGLRFLSGSCPAYTHNFSYFLSWKSLHIRRNFV